jgi:hypothetical protein
MSNATSLRSASPALGCGASCDWRVLLGGASVTQTGGDQRRFEFVKKITRDSRDSGAANCTRPTEKIVAFHLDSPGSSLRPSKSHLLTRSYRIIVNLVVNRFKRSPVIRGGTNRGVAADPSSTMAVRGAWS